jgi:hypothetical protein
MHCSDWLWFCESLDEDVPPLHAVWEPSVLIMPYIL